MAMARIRVIPSLTELQKRMKPAQEAPPDAGRPLSGCSWVCVAVDIGDGFPFVKARDRGVMVHFNGLGWWWQGDRTGRGLYSGYVGAPFRSPVANYGCLGIGGCGRVLRGRGAAFFSQDERDKIHNL